MPILFTFALSQNQTFELRSHYGTRKLDTSALAKLINLCEENYYTQDFDERIQLKNIGRELYQWLDGKEGWLRQALAETDEQKIYLDLIQTSEAQALNPQTQRIALGLAHLPWELLHDGSGFLLWEANILPVRSLQQRQNNVPTIQNRPLRLLFMATSPEHPGVAPLQFEQEETNILKATKDQPLGLVVEESGSVEELGNLVRSYPEDYFDVFHVTGHGVIYTEKAFGKFLPQGKKIKDNTPCFITEDDFGTLAFRHGECQLAQAVWLCLRVQISLTATVETFELMYNRVPQGDEMEALLGAAAVYLCQVRGAEHPQLEELQQRSVKILAGAAGAQGIETQEAFGDWFVSQQLNDPEYFIPRLFERLEEIVGDGWLFERF